MTKSLDAVLERVSRLPEGRQDDIAKLIERLVDLDANASPKLSDRDWAEVDRRLASEPRFASDQDVEAFFRESLA